MLAASVVIVPLGFAVWWAGGHVALPIEGLVLGRRVGGRRGRLLHPAVGGLPARRPVCRLSGRARDRAAAGGGDRGRSCWASGWAWRGRSASSLLLAGFLVLQRPWRAIAMARSGGEGGGRRRRAAAAGARKAAADSAILFALATGVMIATYTAIDRVGTQHIDVVVVCRDPVGDVFGRARRLGRVRRRRRPVALRAGGGSPRRGRRLADAGCVPVHPRRAQRGAAVRASRRCASRRRSSPRPGARSGWARRATVPRRHAGSGPRC